MHHRRQNCDAVVYVFYPFPKFAKVRNSLPSRWIDACSHRLAKFGLRPQYGFWCARRPPSINDAKVVGLAAIFKGNFQLHV